MNVSKVEKELASRGAENQAKSESNGTNQNRKNLPRLQIFVEMCPKVILYSTDDQIELKKLCRKTDGEEDCKENNEEELGQRHTRENMHVNDKDVFDVVSQIIDANRFRVGDVSCTSHD